MDGSRILFVNYCRLNTVTIQDLYPLSHMEECIDSLEDIVELVALDAISGYCQVEMDERGLNEIALTSYHRLYRLKSALFQVKHAQTTLLRAMHVELTSQ